MVNKLPVGILFSGRGSNMSALIEAAKAPHYPAEIKLVICNRPSAKGIEIAKTANVQIAIIDHTKFETREEFDDQLSERFIEAGVELICSAGFMRLLSEKFVAKWHNRQLNIHPSLLPSFKGLNTHQRAIDTGVKITGCTVHFVRNEMDAGPIVAQAAVEVLEGDTKQSLAKRVLSAEHKLYPAALEQIAKGEARVSGETVIFTNPSPEHSPLFSINLR